MLWLVACGTQEEFGPVDGIARVTALALAAGEVGASGSALDPDTAELSRVGDAWEVRIGEVAPGVAGNGVARRVDSAASTVDGVRYEVASRAGDVALAELERRAWGCATALGGEGVGGSALVRGSARIRARDLDAWTASFDEDTVTTRPEGLDLGFGRRCERLPMD